MLAAQDVAVRCKEIGITALHIKLRATGGNRFVICYFTVLFHELLAVLLYHVLNGSNVKSVLAKRFRFQLMCACLMIVL